MCKIYSHFQTERAQRPSFGVAHTYVAIIRKYHPAVILTWPLIDFKNLATRINGYCSYNADAKQLIQGHWKIRLGQSSTGCLWIGSLYIYIIPCTWYKRLWRLAMNGPHLSVQTVNFVACKHIRISCHLFSPPEKQRVRVRRLPIPLPPPPTKPNSMILVWEISQFFMQSKTNQGDKIRSLVWTGKRNAQSMSLKRG